MCNGCVWNECETSEIKRYTDKDDILILLVYWKFDFYWINISCTFEEIWENKYIFNGS